MKHMKHVFSLFHHFEGVGRNQTSWDEDVVSVRVFHVDEISQTYHEIEHVHSLRAVFLSEFTGVVWKERI